MPVCLDRSRRSSGARPTPMFVQSTNRLTPWPRSTFRLAETGLGHGRPIHVHVGGIRRAEEIDEQVLVGHGELNGRARHGPPHGLQGHVVDGRPARCPGRAPASKPGGSRCLARERAGHPGREQHPRSPPQELAPVELATIERSCHPRLLARVGRGADATCEASRSQVLGPRRNTYPRSAAGPWPAGTFRQTKGRATSRRAWGRPAPRSLR